MQRVAYSGGNWNNGATAGVFNVNLNNPRSNVNWNIGFRSALATNEIRQKLQPQGTDPSTMWQKDRVPVALAKKPYHDVECRE
jgi:hypothetical protein